MEGGFPGVSAPDRPQLAPQRFWFVGSGAPWTIILSDIAVRRPAIGSHFGRGSQCHLNPQTLLTSLAMLGACFQFWQQKQATHTRDTKTYSDTHSDWREAVECSRVAGEGLN